MVVKHKVPLWTEADIVSLDAEVKQGQSLVKKMELEVSRDKLLRENERESLIRQSRIDKEKVQDLKNKIHSLNRRNEHKSQYEQMRHIQGSEYLLFV